MLSVAEGSITQKQWWSLSFLGGSAVLLLGLVLTYYPPGSPGMPGCLFHRLTGLFCTGCGITRATYAMSHGDIAGAIAMNPLAVLAAPIVILLWLNEGLGRRGTIEKMATPLRDARFWMVLVLAFTVARNLPWQPFSWLAPG